MILATIVIQVQAVPFPESPTMTIGLIFGGMYIIAELAKTAINALSKRKNNNSSHGGLSKEEFSMLSANRSNISDIKKTGGEMLTVLREIKIELQSQRRK